MHVTSNGVFNNNFDFPLNSRNKKKSRVIAYVHSCVFRVELDESQCKCVESVHSDGKFCVRLSMLRIVG